MIPPDYLIPLRVDTSDGYPSSCAMRKEDRVFAVVEAPLDSSDIYSAGEMRCLGYIISSLSFQHTLTSQNSEQQRILLRASPTHVLREPLF